MRTIPWITALTGLAITPMLGVRLPLWLHHVKSSMMATQQAPQANIDVDNSGYPIERSACLTVALGPSTAAECGNLRVVHALPGIRTFNKQRVPTLIYNSEFAHPYPAVPVYVTESSTTTTPDNVEVVFKLTIGGVDVTKATKLWSGSEWPSGQTTTP